MATEPGKTLEDLSQLKSSGAVAAAAATNQAPVYEQKLDAQGRA